MKILLIEDDLDDIELLQDALEMHGVSYTMHVIHDGSEAVTWFRNQQEQPDIIILDFNLPKVHGREVLLEIKAAPVFKDIPLAILTTSSAKEDMEYSYNSGANRYLIKPATLAQIKNTIETIIQLAS